MPQVRGNNGGIDSPRAGQERTMSEDGDGDGDGDSDYDNDSDEEMGDEGVCLLDVLRSVEERTPLSRILLSKRPESGSEGDVVGGEAAVASLQVRSLVALIESASRREPKGVLVETCSRLVAIVRDAYLRGEREGLDVDPTGADALCAALSSRAKRLPADRKADVDGCETVLKPPDASNRPSAIAAGAKAFINQAIAAGWMWSHFKRKDDGSLLTVGEHRDRIRGGPEGLLSLSMTIMCKDYSFEDCLDAFSHPTKENCAVEELIGDFAARQEGERSAGKVCAFAGIVRALDDHRTYHDGDGGDACGGERCEGHAEYEEEEPEVVHGWSGSWTEDDDKPRNNELCYGVKLGAVLRHIEAQADEMARNPPAGTSRSHPRARFHRDFSGERAASKGASEPAAPDDIVVCWAAHDRLDDDAFGGDDGAYSSRAWSHDGTIGFSHTGGGWKNREFLGHLYGFDLGPEAAAAGGRRYASRELCNEFWATPTGVLADATNDTAWVHADERIKGFAIGRDSERPACATLRSGAKRRKLDGDENEGHGGQNMMVFGSERLGYLRNGVLQEWKLNEANRHDGTNRMVSMGNWDSDIAQWDEDEIVNLCENNWMDDAGSAEVTRGKKPDSIRAVDIVTPSSVGYLSGGRLAFAHEKRSQISMYDSSLREVSRLVGFGSDYIEIVQRPTFERIGDDSTFVASDSSCVKIFDLRSGKAEMTIHQSCINSHPVYLHDAKFVCNKLRRGQGAMLWDLRAQKPLYSLPIKGDTDIAWVPAEKDNQQPLLLTGEGDFYLYGVDFPQEDEWETKDALEAWSQLEKNKSGDSGGNCSIM
ncbi:hypothetical protein ACHAWF_013524 [Thalassiosira exigua]